MKNPLQKILVPTDFSAGSLKALECAAELARTSGSELTIVHIYNPAIPAFEHPEMNLILAANKDMEQLAKNKLTELATNYAAKYNIVTKSMMNSGRVAMEIIQAAESVGADMIIMGTHGAKGLEELFIGSNAGKVVTLAKCPVLTIRENTPFRGLKNIVLPIDRSMHSREKVQIAVRLAVLNKSTIHLLGLTDDEDPEEQRKLNLVMDQVEHLVKEVKISMSRKLVVAGNIAERAMSYAEDVNGDLIIIMTDQESRLTGIFLGPLAKQIVNHSVTPVLSVKPRYRSFESMGLDGDSLIY